MKSSDEEKKRRNRGAGSIYRRPGCKTWTIKYHRNGRPIREATGLTDYQTARQKLNRRLNEVATGTFAGIRMERVRVAELAEYFIQDYRRNGKRTLDDAMRNWELHLQPFFGALRASDVSSPLISRYIDARLQEHAQPGSIRNELANLKRMFNLGYRATPAMVLRVPAFPRLQLNNVRQGFLEVQQYDRLVSQLSDLWLRALVECGCTYGWRLGELLNLRVNQVDLKALTIRLEPGTTKNRDGREVSITGNVFALLQPLVEGKRPEAYVFTRQNGKRVSDFRKKWEDVCIRAGIGRMICKNCTPTIKGQRCETHGSVRLARLSKTDARKICRGCADTVSGSECPKCRGSALAYDGLMFHDLRRTAARDLRRAGVPEGVIMRIGGWRTSSMFNRYAITAQTDISDAVEKLERQRKQQQHELDQLKLLGSNSDFGHDSGANGDADAPETKPVRPN